MDEFIIILGNIVLVVSLFLFASTFLAAVAKFCHKIITYLWD